MVAYWNSLEVAKLVTAVLTPAAIALLGIYIHHVSKRFEEAQWKSQKLIDKRLSIYDQIAPLMNDLLCYFTYVGCWKDLGPEDVIKLKRQLDRKVYLAAPLFPAAFSDACLTFQKLCFQTYNEWGSEPKLRTHFERRRDACSSWVSEDEERFSTRLERTDPEYIKAAYTAVMREFTESFGMQSSPKSLVEGGIPSGIR